MELVRLSDVLLTISLVDYPWYRCPQNHRRISRPEECFVVWRSILYDIWRQWVPFEVNNLRTSANAICRASSSFKLHVVPLLTASGFQSTWGKFFKYFPLKMWFLVALFIFELGSLICGVAQNPTTLIVGRAIAGLGAAGVAVGLFTMLGFAVPSEKRPQIIGYTGATYGIGAVLGPLIGGAFTNSVTWRWVCIHQHAS
jgi:MFS family permease